MVRAWHGRGMASVNQTRPHCVNQMGKTHSKPLSARHGRGTTLSRHGHGMLCVNQPLFAIFSFYHGVTAPSGSRPPHYRGFTITLRHSTLGKTPLDEWSARRRDLYLITHSTHKRETSMYPAGFEPTTPASERPQTDALDHAATGISYLPFSITIIRHCKTHPLCLRIWVIH